MVLINDNHKAVTRFATLEADFQKVHGNTYDYSKVEYYNTTTPITIVCPIHGEFQQIPKSHLNGKGCKLCSTLKTAKARLSTTEAFIEKAKKVYGDFYTYEKLHYTKAKQNGIITCPVHGDFTKRLDHFLNGSSCPSCAGLNGFNTSLPAILYYLSINGGQAYKIGITNKSVKERFLARELNVIQVLATWEYSSGLDALNEEQRILKEFSTYKYTGPDLLESGNTELFTVDVLQLHKDIYK